MRAACSIVAIVVLLRFAWDFASGMGLLLGIPAALLSLTAVAGIALSLRGLRETRRPASRLVSYLAAASIPLAFAASTLDCAGLSLEGCTTVCTVQKVVVLPLVAVACLFRRPLAILVSSAAMLVPHCICLNPVNKWWIHAFGSSPMCFAWGFVAAVLGVATLEGRGRAWLSLGATYASTFGTAGFFIGHHYFHWPW